VRLAGPDGVHRHPGRLDAGRAVPLDGNSRHAIQAGQHPEHPGDPVALLSGRLRATDHDVVDRARVKRGHLGQRGADHRDCHVVGA